MNDQPLFASSFSCSCGRTHTCPIEAVVIEHGATNKAAALLRGLKKVLVVSDKNTRPLAFEALSAGLAKEGIDYQETYFDTTEVLIPNEDALAKVAEGVKGCDAIVGIGSGVINDICKEVSFEQNLPYMILATAPSMDGYASNVSALILKGMKATLTARPPRWIVGDTAILKDAPLDMIRAGMGDILGKFSCLNDWKIACLVTGEHFCQTIYDMVLKEANLCAKNIDGCMARQEEAIGDLMLSLVMVGVAMAYMGNSRPASGCEHHLSHFFEVTGVAFQKPYLAHGIDVAYSTILTMKLREKLQKEDPATFSYAPDPAYEEKIRRVYGPLAGEVLELQAKSDLYQDRLDKISACWPKILEILKEAPTGEEMTALLAKAGYDLEAFVSFYGKERLLDALLFAKDLRARYTIVWLLQNAGLLERYARELVG